MPHGLLTTSVAIEKPGAILIPAPLEATYLLNFLDDFNLVLGNVMIMYVYVSFLHSFW